MQVSIYTQKWNLCCIDNSLNLAQLKFTTSFKKHNGNNNNNPSYHIYPVNTLISLNTVIFLEDFLAAELLQTSADMSSPRAERHLKSHIWLALRMTPLGIRKDLVGVAVWRDSIVWMNFCIQVCFIRDFYFQLKIFRNFLDLTRPVWYQSFCWHLDIFYLKKNKKQKTKLSCSQLLFRCSRPLSWVAGSCFVLFFFFV